MQCSVPSGGVTDEYWELGDVGMNIMFRHQR